MDAITYSTCSHPLGFTVECVVFQYLQNYRVSFFAVGVFDIVNFLFLATHSNRIMVMVPGGTGNQLYSWFLTTLYSLGGCIRDFG